MIPEKKIEELNKRLQQLEQENKELKEQLSNDENTTSSPNGRDYESYFNNSLDGIFIMESIYGVPSSFVEINSSMCRMLGYSKDEIKEFDPLDILAEGEKKRLLNISENILEQQEIYFLTAFRDVKKRRVPVEISIKTLDTSLNPQLIGIARSVEDKDYSLKLKDSTEALLKKIVSGTHEVVMHISGKQRFRFNYISAACQKVLGFSAKELYLNPNIFLENLHPSDYKKFMALMEGVAGTGLPHNFRFLRKDQKLIWIEVYLTNEDKATPLKYGVYAIVHDVTYRHQMERLINKKLKAEHLIAEISRGFIEYKKVKTTIHRTIEKTGLDMGIDCIDLCIGKGNDIKNKYSWLNPKLDKIKKKDVLYLEGTPWIDAKLSKGDFVYLVSPDEIPAEFEGERNMLSDNGIQSMLVSPLEFYGTTFGYLAFYQLNKKREWDRVEINLITTMSGIINTVLKKEITLEEKDDIFSIVNELDGFYTHPFIPEKPKLVLTFNRKGVITGCIGRHALFMSDLRNRCDSKPLSSVFPENVSKALKEHYQALRNDHQPRFFSYALTPENDAQDFGMFYFKENKCLLCLYN